MSQSLNYTQAKTMAKLKREDREGCDGKQSASKKRKVVPTDETMPPRATSFNGYDLSQLPYECLPLFQGEYKGKHSYTANVDGAVP